MEFLSKHLIWLALGTQSKITIKSKMICPAHLIFVSNQF